MLYLFCKRKMLIVVFMAWLILLIAPGSASAATVTTGDALTIDAGEVIEDDVYLFGDVVTISGLIKGDALVFCRNYSY
jgi:hypothetical protein